MQGSLQKSSFHKFKHFAIFFIHYTPHNKYFVVDGAYTIIYVGLVNMQMHSVSTFFYYSNK